MEINNSLLVLFVGLLIGVLLAPFVSGSNPFMIPGHWTHDTSLNIIQPTNTSVDVGGNNNSLEWFNLSDYAGDNIVWDSVNMEFDGSAGGGGGGDPWFNASDAYYVTSALMSNWNASFGWGDHGLIGYLTNYGDPWFNDSDAQGFAWEMADGWNASGNPFDQDLNTTDAPTFATIDTGQGANELYDMDQNVLTTSNVIHNEVNTTKMILSNGEYTWEIYTNATGCLIWEWG